ncbi:helix-turn-helix domain-containing protein [Arsenophonus sp. ENCA]|uniref:helix-turn-helix domain-containing protein n=1 Tax=Arsenophonus sp. ENCA TaxID=1987579 RepID=UPI0025C0E0FA|nr:helix-turn-helix domain-containing protein [Arsenophonus sp. ENCA]
MGRKALPMPADITPEQPLAPDLMNNLNALAEHQQAIMDKYGEGLPYQRERIVHEARFYMAQSAEAMLEAGKRLIILKENEPHGDFMRIVKEQLGLEPRIAQKMAQAALKYLSPALSANAETFSRLGRSKLYELMFEDDEDLIELAEGGTIAGLTLDNVDRMSVRELKAALRKDEAALKRSQQLVAEKEKQLQQLSQQLAGKTSIPTANDEQAPLDTQQWITLTLEGVGDRLKSERLRLGLSQEMFAERCGVKKLTQYNYEKGERHPDTAYLIAAKAIGVDLLFLVTGERSDEASALDVVRDEEEATLLTTFRHIPGETREVAQRTLAAMAEKKAARHRA